MRNLKTIIKNSKKNLKIKKDKYTKKYNFIMSTLIEVDPNQDNNPD